MTMLNFLIPSAMYYDYNGDELNAVCHCNLIFSSEQTFDFLFYYGFVWNVNGLTLNAYVFVDKWCPNSMKPLHDFVNLISHFFMGFDNLHLHERWIDMQLLYEISTIENNFSRLCVCLRLLGWANSSAAVAIYKLLFIHSIFAIHYFYRNFASEEEMFQWYMTN